MSKITRAFCVLIVVLGFVFAGNNFSYSRPVDPPLPPLGSSCTEDTDCNQALCEQCFDGTCKDYCASGECCNGSGVCVYCGETNVPPPVPKEPLPEHLKFWTECLTDANCVEPLKCVDNHNKGIVPGLNVCAECDTADDCLPTCSHSPCNGYEEQAGCDDGYESNGDGCCCDASSGPPYSGFPYCENNQCKFASGV